LEKKEEQREIEQKGRNEKYLRPYWLKGGVARCGGRLAKGANPRPLGWREEKADKGFRDVVAVRAGGGKVMARL